VNTGEINAASSCAVGVVAVQLWLRGAVVGVVIVTALALD